MRFQEFVRTGAGLFPVVDNMDADNYEPHDPRILDMFCRLFIKWIRQTPDSYSVEHAESLALSRVGDDCPLHYWLTVHLDQDMQDPDITRLLAILGKHDPDA